MLLATYPFKRVTRQRFTKVNFQREIVKIDKMQSGKRKVLTVKLNHYEEAFNTVDEKFVKCLMP